MGHIPEPSWLDFSASFHLISWDIPRYDTILEFFSSSLQVEKGCIWYLQQFLYPRHSPHLSPAFPKIPVVCSTMTLIWFAGEWSLLGRRRSHNKTTHEHVIPCSSASRFMPAFWIWIIWIGVLAPRFFIPTIPRDVSNCDSTIYGSWIAGVHPGGLTRIFSWCSWLVQLVWEWVRGDWPVRRQGSD